MKIKRELCEELKKVERQIRAGLDPDSPILMNQIGSDKNETSCPRTMRFEEVVRVMERWRIEGAGEIELRGTEEYLENVIKKVGSVLGSVIGLSENNRLGGRKTVEYLDKLVKGVEKMKNLPFEFIEFQELKNKVLKAQEFENKIQDLIKDQSNISDKFLTMKHQYFDLEVKISSFENLMKKYEEEKSLKQKIEQMSSIETNWHQSIKNFAKMKEFNLIDVTNIKVQLCYTVINSLLSKFKSYVKKRGIKPELFDKHKNQRNSNSNIQNFEENNLTSIFEFTSLDKRIDFLNKENVKLDEICKLKVEIEQLIQTKQKWNDIEFLDEVSSISPELLVQNYKYFLRLIKGVEFSLDDSNVANELPLGTYLEDFASGYDDKDFDEEIPSSLKGCALEIRKNIQKNSEFNINSFDAYIETRNIYRKMKDKNLKKKKI